jgi:hypothetical protein
MQALPLPAAAARALHFTRTRQLGASRNKSCGQRTKRRSRATSCRVALVCDRAGVGRQECVRHICPSDILTLMPNRTEPKTIGQWLRYIVVAIIAIWLVIWMLQISGINIL